MTKKLLLGVLLVGAASWALTRTVWGVDQAHIRSVEGNVQVRESSTAEWKKADKGISLNAGAEILTGSNSSCELTFQGKSGNAARINADSRAVLKSIDPVSIELESGRLFALARHLEKGSSFEVRTPTAMAAARGTGWGQDADSVESFEHEVQVKGRTGGETTLPEGQGIHVNPDGTLGDLFEVPQSDKDEWKKFGPNGQGDDNGIDPADVPSPSNDALFESKDMTSEHENETNDLKGQLVEDNSGYF